MQQKMSIQLNKKSEAQFGQLLGQPSSAHDAMHTFSPAHDAMHTCASDYDAQHNVVYSGAALPMDHCAHQDSARFTDRETS